MNRDNHSEAQAAKEASESRIENAETSDEAKAELAVAGAEKLQQEAREDFTKLLDRFMETRTMPDAEASAADGEESAQIAEKALEAQILILEHEDMLREAQAEAGAGGSANALLERLESLEPILTTGIKSQIETQSIRAKTTEDKARLDALLQRWNAARSGSKREESSILQAVRKLRPGEADPFARSSKLAHDMEGLAIKKNVLAERGAPLPEGDRKEFERLREILGRRIDKEGRGETLRGYEALLDKHFERPSNAQ